ncbi:hypothetical protein [Nitrospina gracilis]|uniref:hypothetical protein n=1 Tax=Nitrospina gracilis TaxID=35801 RepID=UPI001F16CFAB|nr:hypothetical protein [Nitrospina gracilis]MCF8721311.1 hypothetical protein [Nitrospina gracilis Nb-211]
MTDTESQPTEPASPSQQAEFLTQEAPAAPQKTEEEINLNELFPEANQDLNDLFPEPELKTLLKKVHKQKHDIEAIKDRFLEDHDDHDDPAEEEGEDEAQADEAAASEDTPPTAES